MAAAHGGPSKPDLLEAIRASGREFVEAARSLPAEAFERGQRDGVWNAHQLLAHVAAIEWVYARYVDLARLGVPAEDGNTAPFGRTQPHEGPDVATLSAQGGIDEFNAREVAKRARASVRQLLDEFERNRAATLDAVERADEPLLRTPVRSIAGITGSLSAVLQRVAVAHVREHTADILHTGA